MNIVKAPTTLEQLFKIYLDSHYDAALMKHHFNLGLRCIVNTEVAKLKDVLMEKDTREGYGENDPSFTSEQLQ